MHPRQTWLGRRRRMRQRMTYYDLEWEIRFNASRIANCILEDEENGVRLPETIRGAWNLPRRRLIGKKFL